MSGGKKSWEKKRGPPRDEQKIETGSRLRMERRGDRYHREVSLATPGPSSLSVQTHT